MERQLSIEAILAFVEKLPSGFANGPREVLALRELFLRLAEMGELPSDPALWKTLIAPVVCRDEDQQAEFYSRFEALFREDPPPPPPPVDPPPPVRPWRLVAGAGAGSLAILGGLWVSQVFQPIPPPPMPRTPISFLTPVYPESRPKPSAMAAVEGLVKTSDGSPLPGATVLGTMDLVNNQQRRATTDRDGRFRLPPGTDPLPLLVSHPAYEPVLIETARSEIRVGPPRTERTALARIPARVTRHFPEWVSVALGAIPLLAALWLLWWNERRRARLASFEGPLDLRPVWIHARSEEEALFRDADVAILAREMRKRRAEPTGRLAVEPTVLRTAERGGVFTPVRLERKVEREFLVLVERKSERDQQARLWECLLDRLAARGVAIERYRFAGDPRACEAPGAERAWVRLSELAALHPGHEMWILASAERFFHPVTGDAAPWVEDLARWPERAVVRLTEGTEEDEKNLRALGFAVAPASVAGLLTLREERPATLEAAPPYPMALEEGEARWMPGTPAAGERETRSLLRQLRAWLGGSGYRLLLACAPYPELAWSLTLHLALALVSEGREEVLARLVRLPWFRHGKMPEWLRGAMVRELRDRGEAERVLGLLRDFLEHRTRAAEGHGGDLELARREKGAPGGRKRDFVYLAFLTGQRLAAADLEAPRWWKKLLYPDGLRLLGLRREVLLGLGLLAGGGAWWMAERLGRGVEPEVWRSRPVAAGELAGGGNALSAAAVEVAAASVGHGADSGFALRSFERALRFSGAAWTVENGSAGPGMLWERDGAPAAIVERVTAEGVVALELREGRVARVMREAEGRFLELRPAVLRDVYFDFDSAEIREDARAGLAVNAAVMKAVLRASPSAVFVIEGHQDERGSTEFRLALTDRMAVAVREYLAQLAVPEGAMKTVAYGKERPACIEATEACWQRNRRVHIAIEVNREPVPGSGKINPVDGLRYNWIPAGRFRMGCSPGDSECEDDEKPAIDVEITRGFRIGESEVTQEAYQKVRGANPSGFKGSRRPVEQVTWDEARDYCVAIGGRLPTEAEWEYAARAGSTGARYGDLDRVAWYATNTGLGTEEVKRKIPNAWGLYDMLGNVWEWTGDWYDGGYYLSSSRINPSGPAKDGARVVRGGSWGANAANARVSYRYRVSPGVRDNFLGFRCVWEMIH